MSSHFDIRNAPYLSLYTLKVEYGEEVALQIAAYCAERGYEEYRHGQPVYPRIGLNSYFMANGTDDVRKPLVAESCDVVKARQPIPSHFEIDDAVKYIKRRIDGDLSAQEAWRHDHWQKCEPSVLINHTHNHRGDVLTLLLISIPASPRFREWSHGFVIRGWPIRNIDEVLTNAYRLRSTEARMPDS